MFLFFIKRLSLRLFIATGLAPPCLASAGEVRVIAIGANHSFEKKLHDLKFAEADAERFNEAMRLVGLIPTMHTTLLRHASLTEVRDIFKSTQHQAASGAFQKFIFYFSGHANDRGLHLHDGLLPKAELLQLISNVEAHTKIAFLDSCFSGAITTKGVEKAPPFELPNMDFDEPSGSIFLTASSPKQFAFESDHLNSSVFTHHLLAGIYGEADSNHDGIVTVDELYQYVYRHAKLENLNSPNSRRQDPFFDAKLHGQGAIAVSFPAQGSSQLILDAPIHGDVAIASRHGLQFFQIQKAKGQEKSLRLPSGDFLISVRDGKRVGEGRKTLLPEKSSRLLPSDISWERSKAVPVNLKGLSLEQTIESSSEMPGPWRVGVGMHSGFGHENKYGPYLEVTRTGIARDGNASSGVSIAISCAFHRDTFEFGEAPYGGYIYSTGCYLLGFSEGLFSTIRMDLHGGVGETLHVRDEVRGFAPSIRLGTQVSISKSTQVLFDIEHILLYKDETSFMGRRGVIFQLQTAI